MGEHYHEQNEAVDHKQPVELGAPLHALVHGAQEQEEHGEAEHVAELSGQRAENVAAVDRVALHEQEQEGEDGRDDGIGAPDAQEPGEVVGDHGKSEDPEDGYQLEGDLVGDHPVQYGDE